MTYQREGAFLVDRGSKLALWEWLELDRKKKRGEEKEAYFLSFFFIEGKEKGGILYSVPVI